MSELGAYALRFALLIALLGLAAAVRAGSARRPDWTPVAIKAGMYPGQNQDLLVLGTHTAVRAHRQTESAVISRIVKTIIEHGKEFGELHPGGREFTIEKTRFFVENHLVPMPLHPRGRAILGGKRGC